MILSRFLSKRGRTRFSGPLAVLLCLTLLTVIPSIYAQRDDGRYAPRDDGRKENVDSINPGGNWREFDSEDRMTAARRVRFALTSDNNMRENRSVQARVDIFCENGKYKASEFTPGMSLGPPTHPGFWGQPKMEVMVRVNDKHSNRGWNWNGRALSMDKGSARELIGANIFRIEFLGRGGPEIAEFSPSGLDLSKVSHACDLTAKKP